MPDFTVIGSEPRYDAGFFSVETLRVATAGGDEFDRDVVRHCGAVAIVPMLDNETVLCVRQYRVVLDQPLLEVVAGRRDVPDEDPEHTARRELAEEVGMRAGRMIKLAEIVSGPGFTDERLFLFLALDLTDDGLAAPDGHEEAAMTVERVSLASVPDRIAAGDLIDAKSIIGITLAQQYLAGSYPGMA